MIALAFYLFSAMVLFSGVMVITARNPVHSVLFLIFAFFNSAGLFVILGAEFLAMLLVVVYVGAVAVLFLFVVMMMDINVRSLQRTVSSSFKEFTQAMLSASAFGLAMFVVSILAMMVLTNIAAYFLQIIPVDTVKLSLTMLITNPGSFAELPLWAIMVGVVTHDPLSLASIVFVASAIASLWFGNFVATFLVQKSFSEVALMFRRNFPIAWFIALVFGVELFMMVRLWHDSSVTTALVGTSKLISEPGMPNTQALGQLIYTDYLYIFQLSGMILLVAMIGAIVLTLRKREGVKRQNISEQVNRRKEETLQLKDVPIGKGI